MRIESRRAAAGSVQTMESLAVPHQREGVTADSVRHRLDHRERDGAGERGVDRIPAFQQHAKAGLGGKGLARGHDALGTQERAASRGKGVAVERVGWVHGRPVCTGLRAGGNPTAPTLTWPSGRERPLCRRDHVMPDAARFPIVDSYGKHPGESRLCGNDVTPAAAGVRLGSCRLRPRQSAANMRRPCSRRWRTGRFRHGRPRCLFRRSSPPQRSPPRARRWTHCLPCPE